MALRKGLLKEIRKRSHRVVALAGQPPQTGCSVRTGWRWLASPCAVLLISIAIVVAPTANALWIEFEGIVVFVPTELQGAGVRVGSPVSGTIFIDSDGEATNPGLIDRFDLWVGSFSFSIDPLRWRNVVRVGNDVFSPPHDRFDVLSTVVGDEVNGFAPDFAQFDLDDFNSPHQGKTLTSRDLPTAMELNGFDPALAAVDANFLKFHASRLIRYKWQLTSLTAFTERVVGLDIKPGSDTNPINPFSQGVVPVAILGSDVFDVADVDVTTLAFGPDGAAPAHKQGGHFDDVDGDGITDLVSHYHTADTGIATGDEEACVTGETLDGAPLHGCDKVETVGQAELACGLGFELTLLVPALAWLRGRNGRRFQKA